MSNDDETPVLGAQDTIATEQIIITRGFNADGEKIFSLQATGDDYIIHLGMLESAKAAVLAAGTECTCDDDEDAGD